MAFPVIEGTPAETAVSTAGTSHVINLPGSIAAGELLLILLDKGSTAATFNTLAGWTEIVDENSANGITVWAREATGGEGATVTFTSSASTRSASIAYRISGAADVLTQLPQLSTVATGTSTAPNATACTPTGGAKDYLWITFFGMAGEQADDDSLVTGTPANYGSTLQKTCGTAGTNLGGMIGAAHRTNNASSEDAGAFTTVDNAAWRAYTIAIHPAPAAAVLVTDTFDRTNSDTVGNDSLGNAWQEEAGDWDISSNGVIQTDATTTPGCLRCGTDIAYQGHWVEAELDLSDGTGQIGLLVRLDTVDFTALSFEVADGNYKLIEVTAGTPNTVFTGSAHAHTSGELYACEIKTDNTINFYLNGTQVASTTSTFNIGDTRVGLHINESSSGAIRWDNFRAGPGPYPGPPASSTNANAEAAIGTGTAFDATAVVLWPIPQLLMPPMVTP